MLHDDEDFWVRTMLDLGHDDRAAARKFAAVWSIALIAVFDIFSIAALCTGLTHVDRLAETTGEFVRYALVIAIITTLVASLLAGSTVHASLRGPSDPSADTSPREHKPSERSTTRRLRWSVLLVAFAALAIAAAAITVALTDEPAPAPKPPVMMAVVEGKMYCGTVALEPDGTLSVRGMPLDEATFVTIVSACPTRA